jgi:DNA-binding MarR family transcriptional regulator
MDAHRLSVEDWATWRALSIMSAQLDVELDRRLRSAANVSRAEFQVLSTLNEVADNRLRPGELGELLGWEKSRVSHQLTRMESRGLVDRDNCDSDARGTWVSLTPVGRDAVEAIADQYGAAIYELLFASLNDDERARLHDAAVRVLERLNPAVCDIAEENDLASTRRTARA